MAVSPPESSSTPMPCALPISRETGRGLPAAGYRTRSHVSERRRVPAESESLSTPPAWWRVHWLSLCQRFVPVQAGDVADVRWRWASRLRPRGSRSGGGSAPDLRRTQRRRRSVLAWQEEEEQGNDTEQGQPWLQPSVSTLHHSMLLRLCQVEKSKKQAVGEQSSHSCIILVI
jgi:hypothetical protein